jgi:hypothetical protein
MVGKIVCNATIVFWSGFLLWDIILEGVHDGLSDQVHSGDFKRFVLVVMASLIIGAAVEIRKNKA